MTWLWEAKNRIDYYQEYVEKYRFEREEKMYKFLIIWEN